jgi:hypothetical protein
MNCHSKASKQESTGQRTIDLSKLPEKLAIKAVEEIEDDNLLIKWSEESNQADTIIPIEFLIENYPSNENAMNVNFRDTYKVCDHIKHFDYRHMVDDKNNRNEAEVYK